MKKRILLVSALCCLFALGGYGQRLYVGASLGNGFRNHRLTDINGDNFKLNISSFTWKVYAGFGFKFIGLEGGYVDFGKVEDGRNGEIVSNDTQGGTLFATGTFRVLILRFYGKAGVFFRNADIFDFNEFGDLVETVKKDSNFAWGVGIGVGLGIVGLRAEYEGFVVSPESLGLLSFGLSIGLGV